MSKVVNTIYACDRCLRGLCHIKLDDENRRWAQKGSQVIFQKDIVWECDTCDRVLTSQEVTK